MDLSTPYTNKHSNDEHVPHPTMQHSNHQQKSAKQIQLHYTAHTPNQHKRHIKQDYRAFFTMHRQYIDIATIVTPYSHNKGKIVTIQETKLQQNNVTP